jgi:hypothetical protein
MSCDEHYDCRECSNALDEAIRAATADLTQRLADTKGHLRWALEHSTAIQHDPMAWYPIYICTFCEGRGEEERRIEIGDADPNTVKHKSECPYIAAQEASKDD